MKPHLSNVTQEEFASHADRLEKQRNCPTCGAERDQAFRMFQFEQGIIQHLRDARIVKRDSCIQCVQKHIGKAMVLYEELLSATPDNNVNIDRNHLEIIGNLQAGADEAEEWPELWEAIDTAEREYRYRGIGPDWDRLARQIAEVAGAESEN